MSTCLHCCQGSLAQHVMTVLDRRLLVVEGCSGCCHCWCCWSLAGYRHGRALTGLRDAATAAAAAAASPDPGRELRNLSRAAKDVVLQWADELGLGDDLEVEGKGQGPYSVRWTEKLQQQEWQGSRQQWRHPSTQRQHQEQSAFC
jgi:hypothetical protein